MISVSTPAPFVQLNGPAPDFTAATTHGPITFSQWASGRWVILFSHPADFTPVCTTEFLAFARRVEEFEARGVSLLGTSVDSIYAHIAWVRNIEEKFGVRVPFPIVADLDQNVAQRYFMVHEPSSSTATVRTVFFIDPKFKIRTMLYYPLNLGRGFDELIRIVDGLQAIDASGIALPADWKPGDPGLLPPPNTSKEADMRACEAKNGGEWYLQTREL